MRSGGGVCLAGIGDASLPRISPRIRALQDRLVDSLPADGAWECLSPAQRDAIISLHHSRLTGHPDGYNTTPVDKRRLNQFSRSRSYEDKLESETDDSGVRLISGGTHSSTSVSLEDDSSDPGVKKSGRFTKSATADRSNKKDKHFLDNSKKKAVANAVGNVNKILAKQLHKGGGPVANKVTVDSRNVQADRNRYRTEKHTSFDQLARTDKIKPISRKNILQRYENMPCKRTQDHKGSVSSEDYDGARVMQMDISCENLSKLVPNHSRPMNLRRSSHSALDVHIHRHEYHNTNHKSTEQLDKKSNARSKLNSFDYRNALNQDSSNKYSSNWNNMILSDKIAIKPSSNHHSKVKSLDQRVCNVTATGNAMPITNHKKVVDHRHAAHNQEKILAKKYIRSKSLDRKYLEESSDDDVDFEHRRRAERMKRYAKANAEWDLQKEAHDRQQWQATAKFHDNDHQQRSRSAWDLSRMQRAKDEFDESDQANVFRSRKIIINKWKSEDNELDVPTKNRKPKTSDGEFNRDRWQRHSCDFDLDFSDPEFPAKLKRQPHGSKRNLRKSTEAHLDLEADEVFESSSHTDWEESLEGEMRILHERKGQRKSDSCVPYAPPPHSKYQCIPPQTIEAPPRRRPKDARKLSPQLDQNNKKMAAAHPRQRTHLTPPVKHERTKQGFRGKLKLFKSILSL